jgi:hypothetical protein
MLKGKLEARAGDNMRRREELVETLERLGPENVVDGMELCPACDGLSPT